MDAVLETLTAALLILARLLFPFLCGLVMTAVPNAIVYTNTPAVGSEVELIVNLTSMMASAPSA